MYHKPNINSRTIKLLQSKYRRIASCLWGKHLFLKQDTKSTNNKRKKRLMLWANCVLPPPPEIYIFTCNQVHRVNQPKARDKEGQWKKKEIVIDHYLEAGLLQG